MPSKIIATGLALLGFAVAIVAGLLAGHPTLTLFEAQTGPVTMGGGGATLARAMICMGGCYAVGLVLAEIARRAIDENVEAYRQLNPLEETDASDEEVTDVELFDAATGESLDDPVGTPGTVAAEAA
jgi:hypothetical protein